MSVRRKSPYPSRREFIATVTALAAVRRVGAVSEPPLPVQPAGAVTAPMFMYVGSFTGEGRGRGEGISVFRRARASDPWSLLEVVKDADPSWLKIDRQRRFLYSAHGGGTHASAYRIDPATGKLTLLNREATGGTNGVSFDIDATGRFAAVPNYATGSLAILPIKPDGSLGPLSDLATMTGEPGPHRREQTVSHPHHAPFDPSGRFIVVPDKGFDRTFVYRLDAGAGKLVTGTPPFIVSRSGAAPRHVDFHPRRPYAYVINELDSTIAGYHFEPEKGVLKPFQVITTLPSSHTGNNSCAEIVIAPSGRFAYGSNRGHDSIAIFSIDQDSGTLTSIGWEPTQGRTPRFFGLDPTGTHLYAANQNSDTVVIFRVDQNTGRLAATGEVVKVVSPSTIVFR